MSRTKRDKKTGGNARKGKRAEARKARHQKPSPGTSQQQDLRRKHPAYRSEKKTHTGAASSKRTWQGMVSAHPDGFGFVDVEGREKGFFLPHEEMRQVMHGDIVEVRPVRRRGRESAEIVRIIKRAPGIVVGQFRIIGGTGIVQPRSSKMPQNILVAGRDSKGAHDGDWVWVEIQRGSLPMRGRVTEVLGQKLQPSRLIDLIIAELELPDGFPETVLAEAARIPDTVPEEECAQRRDLTGLPFVTIDGEDARDFDDAICVLPRGEGFEAWVAIADVAHYVRPRSALDKEALARSNSFYFPDRVIPMLPEKLSNGLCSLLPNTPRLAVSVRMRFDANGRRRAIQVYDSVIHSHARLTYAQASSWLEGRDPEAIPDSRIRTMLDDAARLFRKLETQRKKRGALDLDVPEVRAILHEGRVTDMNQSSRNMAHHLIEELMLAANTAVAEFMESHRCPLLYRVHPAPKPEAIESLNEFLAPFGLSIPLPRGKKKDLKIKPGTIQKILEQTRDKAYAHVLHKLVLRAMQQARYTPENEGHFGLAFRSYCHFTSPIRRYADLTVHRRLKALLHHDNPDKVQPAKSLPAIGEQTSTQERKQQRAEWDTQAMLAALYHQKDIGHIMQARISGFSKRRVFVELEPTLAEASIAIEALPGTFELDENRHRLVARQGGRSYALGDPLEVVIDATDPVRGQILARLHVV